VILAVSGRGSNRRLNVSVRLTSSNPIWRLGPVFALLGSCNKKFKAVVVDDDAAGRKSDGWSMNLKRADWSVRSSAEAVAAGHLAGEAVVMHLTHLGLPVADEQRSVVFYQAYFGFDPGSGLKGSVNKS
jgi:hypothetical protein